MDDESTPVNEDSAAETPKKKNHWLGRKHTEEAKRKMSAAKKGSASPFKGKHHSEETKRKLSEAYKGRPGTRNGIRHTLETRLLISQICRERTLKGAACHSYKDGKYAERMSFRRTADYKRWRYDVYFRDKFSCQLCGDNRGGNLNAHHIFAYADYPELRINLDNGITLCELCHDSLHFKPDSIRVLRRRRGLIRNLRILKRKK